MQRMLRLIPIRRQRLLLPFLHRSVGHVVRLFPTVGFVKSQWGLSFYDITDIVSSPIHASSLDLHPIPPSSAPEDMNCRWWAAAIKTPGNGVSFRFHYVIILFILLYHLSSNWYPSFLFPRWIIGIVFTAAAFIKKTAIEATLSVDEGVPFTCLVRWKCQAVSHSIFFLCKRRKKHLLEDVHSYSIHPYPSLMQHSIPFPEHTLTSKTQHQQKRSPRHNARKIPSPPSSEHAIMLSKTTSPTSHPTASAAPSTSAPSSLVPHRASASSPWRNIPSLS